MSPRDRDRIQELFRRARDLDDGSRGALPNGDPSRVTGPQIHSLIDYSRTDPALPPGHPFSGVQVSSYWSSTTRLMYGTVAWMVGINGGVVIDDFKSADHYVWPVRGGQ